MTQIVLPITSRTNTDDNFFSDVYTNDQAILAVVNGQLGDDNFPAGFFDAVNVTKGVSTVTHTASATATLVVSHGLGTTPSVVLVAPKSSTIGTIVVTCEAGTYTGTQFTISTCCIPIPAGGGNFVLNSPGASVPVDVAWVAYP